MLYFDAACIAKCYLNEPGAERVRQIARQAPGLASCEISRVEFASVLARHRREGHLTAAGFDLAQRAFDEDERDRVWRWLPISSTLIELARRAIESLPPGLILRAGDALHLACARQHGFAEVYSNDRHLLAAAPHFQLAGMDPLA